MEKKPELRNTTAKFMKIAQAQRSAALKGEASELFNTLGSELKSKHLMKSTLMANTINMTEIERL